MREWEGVCSRVWSAGVAGKACRAGGIDGEPGTPFAQRKTVSCQRPVSVWELLRSPWWILAAAPTRAAGQMSDPRREGQLLGVHRTLSTVFPRNRCFPCVLSQRWSQRAFLGRQSSEQTVSYVEGNTF